MVATIGGSGGGDNGVEGREVKEDAGRKEDGE